MIAAIGFAISLFTFVLGLIENNCSFYTPRWYGNTLAIGFFIGIFMMVMSFVIFLYKVAP